jgi:uncharacterized Tic20 family protein
MSSQPPLPDEGASKQPPFAEPKPAPLPGGELSKEAKQMAMLAHLLGIFLGFLGPLIIYLTKKDDDEFIEDQSKEALNFQITLIIAYLVVGAVYSVVGLVTCGFGLLIPLPLIVTVFQFLFGIQGSMQASEGVRYRYPNWICLKLVK